MNALLIFSVLPPRPVGSALALVLLSLAAPLRAQTLAQTLAVGANPSRVAVNPVTGKTYVATNLGGISTSDAFNGSAFYLIRARNSCGGRLGDDSNGNPLSGRSCP